MVAVQVIDMRVAVETQSVDCGLGQWMLSRCQPRWLDGLVQGLWLFDGFMSTLRERTFPDGSLEIIVHLGERYSVVLDLINAGGMSLAAAAHDAGYYDQPHMTAEFRAISGFTPGEFLASARYPNSASVAEF